MSCEEPTPVAPRATTNKSGNPCIYGFAFDAWCVQETSPPGGLGGLWDDQLQPKRIVALLDLGPYA